MPPENFEQELRSIRDARELSPEFQRQWRVRVRRPQDDALRFLEELGVEYDDWDVINQRFGRLYSCAVIQHEDADGGSRSRALWDQYGVSEGPSGDSPEMSAPGLPDDVRRQAGAISVPYLATPASGQTLIGAIHRVRAHVADRRTHASGFAPSLYELPRGFARLGESATGAAIREWSEEHNQYLYRPMRASQPVEIGRANANTAFYSSDISVVAVRVELAAAGATDTWEPQPPDPIEPLRHIPAWIPQSGEYDPAKYPIFLSFDELCSKMISAGGLPVCALSAAALLTFSHWARRRGLML